ncbi:inorganic phosphate transporter [Neisseria sp. Ec49-e6-T10]|uniref:inorganic phosphate transporter n=1 Tax=Neisseria sp. Ec49-e6-T10 TaxID=3140744 RepID=UPI003EB8E74E
MFELFSDLSLGLILLLLLSLLMVLAFEFINGFHDTANAVATVIYTQSMKPTHAVIASGLFNFIGVATGGLAVAYSIIHLLPVDVLISNDTNRMLAMTFALLIGAITWNIGTWYFGLPASSSHTLIGSILGVGLVNTFLAGEDLATGVNWSKAIDVGLALLISPFVGFIIAGIMLLCLKRFVPEANIHKSPYQRNEVEGRKHPPFWTRFFLILSALGVSFAHGSNDGQKGVGLVMMILIAIVPAGFVINLNTTQYEIERTLLAASRLESFQNTYQTQITQSFSDYKPLNKSTTDISCQIGNLSQDVHALKNTLAGIKEFKSLSADTRWKIRSHLMCLDDAAKHFQKLEGLSKADETYLKSLRKDLALTTEYAPLWVIFAVATALGLGTMVGWKRVVKTVGEGIGKKEMTYAQGVCAQVTATISIGFANLFGLPVSTTQVLSSGVAGTMVANQSGLQWVTIRNILLAWLFTFPVAMILSGGLFFLLATLLA